jgi:hypothetical protein
MVQKSVHELNLNETMFEHDRLFNISALSAGLSYDVLKSKGLRTSIGTQVSLYWPAPGLYELYGKNPVSAQVFLRIYPPRMLLK